jgi:uncharacterized membrane protein YbhN (UPF0104 family)
VSKRWRLLGALALLALLAWRLDWGRLGAAFGRLRVEYWALAVVVYVLAQTVSSWRWQLLAGALGYGGPWHRYLAHYGIGMFFNLVLPTSVGGDVVRAWYLSQAEGGRAAALMSVVADRASGLVVLVVLACIAAICCPVPLAPRITWTVSALGAGLLVGLLALPMLPVASRWPVLGAPLARLADIALYVRRPRLLFVATVLSLVVQAANVVLLWLIGLGLGLEVPFAYYGVVMPLVALLTLLPISVNGLGLRELGTVVLLAPLGVPAEQAVTLAFLQFCAFSATSLLGGIFYLVGGYPRFRAAPAGAGREGPGDAEPVRGGADQGRTRQPPAAA